MASELAVTMKAIVDGAAPFLKVAGFRRRRSTFNRTCPDGVIHVVNFWMAPFEPPAWTEVPDLRERLYGNFRIDAGVFVPEMNRSGEPKGDWINEYNCQLRRTQAAQSSDQPDAEWWPITKPTIAARSVRWLDQVVLPWLDRFSNKADVIAEFERVGFLALGMGPAGALDVADLVAASGDQLRAHEILSEYVCRPSLNGPHRNYLDKYLRDRGHADLADLSRRQLGKRDRVRSICGVEVMVRIHWRTRPWTQVGAVIPAETVVQIDDDPATGEQFAYSAPIDYERLATELVPDVIRADQDYADYSVRVEFADVGHAWQRVAG